MKKLCLFLGCVMCAAGVYAADDKPEILGTYDSWTAYVYTHQGEKTCYMTTTPTKSQGKYSKRGDVFLSVAHHPDKKEFDVVNVMAGYTYKKGSKPVISVDKNKGIYLVSYEDGAWTKDKEADAKLIGQMKKGSAAVLQGSSVRGTLTTDTFSMKGFSKAYRDIQKACGRE